MSASSKDVQEKVVADKPITIKDILVCAASTDDQFNPAGEFGRQDLTQAQQAQTTDRLYTQIETLVRAAAARHRVDYCDDNELKVGNENKITRLITNEFFFYTQKPLSLAEFQSIQQRVCDLAKDQPENLHLILASFAVVGKDYKVMNVVAHVACGPHPRLNFIVKNLPSDHDPKYSLQNPDGTFFRLHNATSGAGKKDYSQYSNVFYNTMRIDNQAYQFTYKNVLPTRTASNDSFYTCIDICLDHSYGIAKHHLTQEMIYNSNAKDVSHVVVSNTIVLDAQKSLGTVTHATPMAFTAKSKSNVTFGTPYSFSVQSAKTCSQIKRTDLIPPVQQSLSQNDDEDLTATTNASLDDIYEKLELKMANSLSGKNQNTWTAIEEASIKRHLQAESDPNKALIKKNGTSLLHMAAERGNTELCNYLLEEGIPHNVNNRDLQTPLHCACIHGHVNAALLLLDAGSEIYQADNKDETICMTLAGLIDKGSENACRILVQIAMQIDDKEELKQVEEVIVQFIETLDVTKRHDFYHCIMQDRKNRLIEERKDTPILDAIKAKFPGIETKPYDSQSFKQELGAIKAQSASATAVKDDSKKFENKI